MMILKGWTKCHNRVIIFICPLIKMDKTTAPSEFSWQELILMALTPEAVSVSKFVSNFKSGNVQKH